MEKYACEFIWLLIVVIFYKTDTLPSKLYCNASRDWYQTSTDSHAIQSQNGEYLQAGCFPPLPLESTILQTQETKQYCQETLWTDLQTLLANPEVADQLCTFFQTYNDQTNQDGQKEHQDNNTKEERIPAATIQELNEIQARDFMSSLHAAAAASNLNAVCAV